MSDETPAIRRLIIHDNAARDIERITDYLADNSSIAKAVSFQNAIANAMEYLLTMPLMGAPYEVQNPLLQKDA